MRWDRCVMVVELFVCFVPSSWGIFVYKLETFIDIRIVSLPTFVFSMKMIKSSGILRIGLLQLQHKLGQCLHERGYSLGRAVATWDYRSTDRYVYFRELIEYWYTRRIGSLWKPSLGHVINVFALTHFFNDLINPFLHVFHYRCFERLWLFVMTVIPLSTFLRFNTKWFFNSFKATTSLHDELFFGLVTVSSASCGLTFY